jgi:uncharacterized cupin superfamily protein
MTPEAQLEGSEVGFYPTEPGWFIVNARETVWVQVEGLAAKAPFEAPNAWFSQVGIGLNLLSPGEPMAFYHAEEAQEDFLVLSGECVLVVEGKEHRLRAWDFFHCPSGTEHVLVGAGQEPCLVLAVGARVPQERFVYPLNEVAARYGASVAEETTSPDEAYAGFPEWRPIPCPPGFPPP